MKKGLLKNKLIILSIVLLLLIPSSVALINSSLRLINDSTINYLSFDEYGQSNGSINFGSNSYMDDSPTNPNMFLDICHPNLTANSKIDLVYTSENESLFSSILQVLPQTISLSNASDANGTYYCSRIDVDLSASKALYPGFINPIIVTKNISYNYNYNNYNASDFILLPRISQWFNGSYDIGINVEGPPKVYLISVRNALDDLENPINSSGNFLLTSILNSSNISLVEGKLSPGGTISYRGNFLGGETVYVNGVLALKLRIYNPCDPINESGYYIMNKSIFNHNETCIKINNTDNLVLNFAGELIDGDDYDNGSQQTNACPILIEDSQNITIENLLTQQYHDGICIKNSSVAVFGTGSFSNLNGAKVYDGSHAKFVELFFSNNDSEILAINDSTVSLIEVNLTSAFIKSDFKNVKMSSVVDPPETPYILNLTDIGQWVELKGTGVDTYTKVSFYYDTPLPNGVVTDNLSIFEYNGTYEYINISVFNVTTNSTSQEEKWNWTGGEWLKVFTIISPSESLIIGPNVSNYSVYAPYGFDVPPEPEPEPEPVPKPSPQPQAGPSSGGGGTPSAIEDQGQTPAEPDALEIELQIPRNITLMQGEAGSIPFNVSNIGNVVADNLIIGPEVQRGWDSTNYSILRLLPGDNESGDFQIGVYEKAVPGRYFVPVSAMITGDDGEPVKIVTELLRVYVIPRGRLSRIKVLEYPPEIIAKPFTKQKVSFLVENVGDKAINNISIKLEPNDCLLDVTGAQDVGIGEMKSITYELQFGDVGECNYNMKFVDDENTLVGFAPIKFVIEGTSWQKEPVKLAIMILVILGWTVLSWFIIIRKRKYRNSEEEE